MEKAGSFHHITHPGAMAHRRFVSIALSGFDQHKVGLVEGLARFFKSPQLRLQAAKVREQMSEKIRITG